MSEDKFTPDPFGDKPVPAQAVDAIHNGQQIAPETMADFTKEMRLRIALRAVGRSGTEQDTANANVRLADLAALVNGVADTFADPEDVKDREPIPARGRNDTPDDDGDDADGEDDE